MLFFVSSQLVTSPSSSTTLLWMATKTKGVSGWCSHIATATRPWSKQDGLVFHNIAPKLGSDTFRICFYNLIWLYCPVGWHHLHAARASPRWKQSCLEILIVKAQSEISAEDIGWLPCLGGLPWRQLSIWTSFKNQARQCVSRRLWTPLFNVALFGCSKVYAASVGDALHLK